MNRSILFSLASLSIAAGSACSTVDQKTQVTVALSAETEVPRELDMFTVRVISTRTGELRFSKEYFPTSGRDFPTTLAVVPLDEDSLGSPLRIQIEGLKGGRLFLQRQAVVSYFRDRNILLSLPLRMACFDFKDCGDNATCSGGQCVDATLDSSTLRDFDATTISADAPTCFDEQRCLASATAVDVQPDCTFAIPPGTARSLGNIAIRWAAAPERILGLEAEDAQEGWTRLSDDRGRLSQGSCDSHFQRRDKNGLLVADWAKVVYFDATCDSKTAARPACFSQTTQHAGVGAVVP